ncbi:MAG TPA: GatB/YqeY domain-containing protein [Oligoflexia bacterium]|nr:GatB/YqeY domain-containing protein [Oligoflexia bacterium]HMP47810.1 GatB/YqeY domain-containing protein [Oligoflexia bacterium]
MSELKAKLQSDLKEAMKAREQDKVTNLRGIMAAIKQIEVDSRTEVGDDKIIDILQKQIKIRKDALHFAEEQKREDLIVQNKNEISLIQSYLGTQLGDEELQKLIKTLIEGGASTMGSVMGALQKDYRGKFDGKRASELAKSLIG